MTELMTKTLFEQSTLQHLLNISIQLGSEKNTDILMENILMAAIDVALSLIHISEPTRPY